MGLLDKVFHKASDFDTHTMVTITTEGKAAIDNDMIKDLKQYDIISTLDQHSPRSLSDLSKETKIPIGTIKNQVLVLQRQKMVKIGD